MISASRQSDQSSSPRKVFLCPDVHDLYVACFQAAFTLHQSRLTFYLAGIKQGENVCRLEQSHSTTAGEFGLNPSNLININLKGLGLATQSVLAKLPPEDGKQVICSKSLVLVCVQWKPSFLSSKHHLFRLWQVWWELWPQTWELPSPLKQNPPHSKLSRFVI